MIVSCVILFLLTNIHNLQSNHKYSKTDHFWSLSSLGANVRVYSPHCLHTSDMNLTQQSNVIVHEPQILCVDGTEVSCMPHHPTFNRQSSGTHHPSARSTSIANI